MAKERKKTVAGMIFSIIWTILALIVFVVGLIVFIQVVKRPDSTTGEKILAWIFWGFCCGILMLKTTVKALTSSAKDGWNQGANEYSTNITIGDNYAYGTTTNHPYRGAILGIIGGLLAACALGPIQLAVYIVIDIVYIISCISFFAKKN